MILNLRLTRRVMCCEPNLTLLLMQALLFSVISLGNSHAQSVVEIETAKRPEFSVQGGDDVGIKLAPELRAAARAEAAFVGLSARGNSLLRFEPTASTDEVNSRIAALNLQQFGGLTGDNATSLGRGKLLVFSDDPGMLRSKEVGGIPVIDRHIEGRFLVLESMSGTYTATELKSLAGNPLIRYVEPNFRRSINEFVPPNDPVYRDGRLWGLKTIHAESGWARATTSSIVVAVLDTGVDAYHNDLKENIDHRGYDVLDPSKAPDDDNGHGTHVAGIIGAVDNSMKGGLGVLWSIKIIPIKIFSASGSGSGTLFDVDVVKAIDYAIANHVGIINSSWGGPNFSFAVKEAINRSEAAGILFVAAATNDFGNDNDASPRYPASYGNANIISVLSVEQDDSLSAFSDLGPRSVHLGAPGGKILGLSPGNGYISRSGTSQAAPFVSGAAALIWSLPEYRTKTAVEIKQLILDNVRKVDSLVGKCQTAGVLDLSFLGLPVENRLLPANAGNPSGTQKGSVVIRQLGPAGARRDQYRLDSPEIPVRGGLPQILRSLRGESVSIDK